MAVIDELVTILRYEVEPSGIDKVGKVEKKTGDLEKGTSKLSHTFQKHGAAMGKYSSGTGLVASSLTRVAAALTGAISAGAAFSYSMRAGGDSKELKHFADSLDLNASQLRLWGSAIKNAGGSAESFKSDLKGIWGELGSVDFGQVRRDADELKRIYEESGNSLSEATTWGAQLGYSPDSVRFLVQGSQGITAALEESRQKGQEVSDEVIAANERMAKSYASLWETVDSIGTKVVGSFAPALTRATDAASAAISRNQGAFENWGKSFETTIDSILAGFQTNVESLTKSTDELKLPNEQARIAALTPEQADAEREKRTAAMRNESLVSGARTLVNIVTDPLNAGTHLREGQARTEALQERENVWEGARPTRFKYGEPRGILENLSRFLLGEQRPQEVELQRREKTRQEIEDLTRHPAMPSPRLAGDFDPVEFRRQAHERYLDREGQLPEPDKAINAWSPPRLDASAPEPSRALGSAAEIFNDANRPINQIAAERMPTPPTTVNNESITNNAGNISDFSVHNIDNSLHTAEQRATDAAVASVSEFGGKDLRPESEMDKKYFQPEQVAEEMREKSEPVPASMLFGNASPNIKVQFDPSTLPPVIAPPSFLMPHQSSFPESANARPGNQQAGNNPTVTQNIEINIDGSRMDAVEIGQRTIAELNQAATRGDYTPFIK